MSQYNIFDDDDELDNADSPTMGTAELTDTSFDADFDHLRSKTARTSSTYDEMDMTLDDLDSGSQLDFALSNFTTSQKLILLALLMLDIVAVGFGFLVLLGRV